MKHEYVVSGMSCMGCVSHVKEALLKVEHVSDVSLDLEAGKAWVEMTEHVTIEDLKAGLRSAGGNYDIHPKGHQVPEKVEEEVLEDDKPGTVYYCPMHCEGDKTYEKSGSCPVCGMALVKMVQDNKEDEPDENYLDLKKKFIISIIFTVPIFLISMLGMFPSIGMSKILEPKYWGISQLVLSIPVVFYANWMFFVRAYASIRRMSLNMFTLIGIGAGAAWGFSVVGLFFPDVFPSNFKDHHDQVFLFFESASVILTLVLMGQLLEAIAHSKTSNAVKELLNLVPNKSTVIRDGKEIEVDIDEIVVGDLIRIKPGNKIPVDGVLSEGEGFVDESMVTGEPVPVQKQAGDSLSAGTLNEGTSFVMKAEKIGKDTLLYQIIEMVNNASRSQAPIQRLADRISKYFVPVVILISVVTFVVWYIFGPEPNLVYAFVNGIAVLIIACPCALGLATPMSVMVGIGEAAKAGVLIKDAEKLEMLAQFDVLVIDKTGTLTEGRPTVENFVVSNEENKDSLMGCLAALNANSQHPFARASVSFVAKDVLPEVKDFKEVTGQGVQGDVDGKAVVVGTKTFLESLDLVFEQGMIDESIAFQDKGSTVSFIAVDGKVAGFVVFTDKIKEGTGASLRKLQNAGIEIVLMTGDNERTAKSVADELKIDTFFANCMPQDKLAKIESFQNEGRLVAMAGDGINDAPSLAKANIGVAMGGGSDVAIQTADITLLYDDIESIVKARKLGVSVMRNIKQNLFFALIYNSIGVPVAAGVLFPFFGILLSPMIAAAAMSFSSVSVISNSLRLKRLKL